jgi:hypothetical protein
MPPTSRYIKGLVLLIKCQFHTLIHDRIQWKHCNLANLEILNFEWDLKFYFLHMKSNEVGTTLKHPETINGNVKNLNYFKNLTLPLITRVGEMEGVGTSLNSNNKAK